MARIFKEGEPISTGAIAFDGLPLAPLVKQRLMVDRIGGSDRGGLKLGVAYNTIDANALLTLTTH